MKLILLTIQQIKVIDQTFCRTYESSSIILRGNKNFQSPLRAEETIEYFFRWQVGHTLQRVEVEGRLPWVGTVEAGFEEGGPLAGLSVKGARVVLAHPSKARYGAL